VSHNNNANKDCTSKITLYNVQSVSLFQNDVKIHIKNHILSTANSNVDFKARDIKNHKLSTANSNVDFKARDIKKPQTLNSQ
jgi:type IV secretory pathway VirB6-like protein